MSLYQQFFSVKDSFSIVLHMDFRFIVTVLPAETPHCGISCSKNTKKPKLPPRKSHCSDLCLVRNNHGFSKGKIRSVRPSVSPYIGPLRLFKNPSFLAMFCPGDATCGSESNDIFCCLHFLCCCSYALGVDFT